MMAMADELRKVLRRVHYPLEVMLVCVRWYAAYPLSLRYIEEMMAERGVRVDHATIHRWAVKILCRCWPRCSESEGAWPARVGEWTRPTSWWVGIGSTCTELSTA